MSNTELILMGINFIAIGIFLLVNRGWGVGHLLHRKIHFGRGLTVGSFIAGAAMILKGVGAF